MADFAKIENNVVVNVIIADQGFIDSGAVDGLWLETTRDVVGGVVYEYSNPNPDGTVPPPVATDLPSVRKNYGGIGRNYDPVGDASYEDQPFASWTLNKTTYLWEAPVAKPDDGKNYAWNETDQRWDLVE